MQVWKKNLTIPSMSQKTLHERYQTHLGKVSDKWSIYLDVYQRLFEPHVDRPINLLEIGIQNGGSLEVWTNHFPHALHLVGCDIDPICAKLRYDDPRVSVIVGDANTDVSERLIANVTPEYDIVIDDGSHVSGDIVRSFVRYFKRVRNGGFFLAEDLHCSYWKEFDGGLFDPQSSIAFFKRLVDVVNHEHWGVPGARAEILRGFAAKYGCEIDEALLASIHSVEFFNSICVVRKAPALKNELGPRIFAGTTDLVSSERLSMPVGKAAPPSQANNRWSGIAELPEEHQDRLLKEVQAQTVLIQELREEAAAATAAHAVAAQASEQVQRALSAELEAANAQRQALSHHVDAMTRSVSWRVTAPLRYVRRLMK